MPRPDRRVLITGLGVISPLGDRPEVAWETLAAGRSKVGPIRAFPVDGLPIDAGGEVADFKLKNYAIPRLAKPLQKSVKYMARDIQLAVSAALRAVADSGLDTGGVDPTRFGIVMGAGLMCTELDELAAAIDRAYPPDGDFDYGLYGREGIPLIAPYWLLKYLPNLLSAHITILLDCQGPSNTITEAEAASILSIGEAYRIIQRGRADAMICGGADSKIHPMSLVRIGLLHQMSRRAGDPAAACRPFDLGRDGWVAGEGSGVLILEERDHALARGAKVYGEVLGFGSGCDAFPAGGLDPQGAGTEVALRATLRDAGLEPAEVGHLNAHGGAMVDMDLAESRAIRRVFGDSPGVAVTALKGYMGNLAAGAGAVEAIGSLLGVNRGLVPSTVNCDQPDPECGLDVVRGSARPTSNPIFLKSSLTRYGQAAALAIRGNPGVDGTPAARL